MIYTMSVVIDDTHINRLLKSDTYDYRLINYLIMQSFDKCIKQLDKSLEKRIGIQSNDTYITMPKI